MNRFTFAVLPLFAAAPAFAGNIAPVPLEPAPVFAATPVAPAYSFTGGYIGANLGYADVSPDDGAGTDLDGNGLIYGLRAGYDYDFGPALLGGFVQYDKGNNIDLGVSGVELDDVTRAGVRVGRAAGANLFYAAGGYAHASTDAVGSADGYFAGLGYERLIGTNLSVGAEALYHDFDEFDGASTVDAKATTVGVNLNFRF